MGLELVTANPIHILDDFVRSCIHPRMGQILVWECERTGQLFREKRKYTAHLAKLRRQDTAAEKERQRIIDRDSIDATLYECGSFTEVENWLIKHWDRLLVDHKIPDKTPDCRSKVKSIRFFNMRFNNSQSNSHSAPRGKSSNWGGMKRDEPRGYPGWYGRVEVEYTGAPYGISEVLRSVNVCTGCGGCGSFDVTLWLDDFPHLLRNICQQYPSLTSAPFEVAAARASRLHDVIDMDRRDYRARARDWYNLTGNIRDLHEVDIETPYSGLDHYVDYLARLFGNSPWRYYVSSALGYQKAERYENMARQGCEIPILPLGDRMWQMREFLVKEPEMAVEWKLSGDIDSAADIVDLKLRAERLLREGKITALAPAK